MGAGRLNNLTTCGIIIDGRYYNVLDFPYDKVKEEGPDVLRKATAYRISTDMTKGVFPYRGIIKKNDHWSWYTADIGIYMKELGEDRYQMRIAYPRTKKDKEQYSETKVKDIVVAAINDKDQLSEDFYNRDLSVDEIGEAFMPPIHPDDDPMNMMLKCAIRLKEAPFDAYSKRINAMVVDKHSSTEGSNTRNNIKRAFRANRTVSPTKMMQYADIWQLDIAVIIKDRDGAIFPMFDDPDSQLVMFPGNEFVIDPSHFVDANKIINDAIYNKSSTSNEDIDDDEIIDTDEENS